MLRWHSKFMPQLIWIECNKKSRMKMRLFYLCMLSYDLFYDS